MLTGQKYPSGISVLRICWNGGVQLRHRTRRLSWFLLGGLSVLDNASSFNQLSLSHFRGYQLTFF